MELTGFDNYIKSLFSFASSFAEMTTFIKYCKRKVFDYKTFMLKTFAFFIAHYFGLAKLANEL